MELEALDRVRILLQSVFGALGTVLFLLLPLLIAVKIFCAAYLALFFVLGGRLAWRRWFWEQMP